MTPPARQVRVVAALITSDLGQRVLVQQRPAGKRRAFLWEFPGGKVESGESDECALRREAREELGVDLEVGQERFHAQHIYPDLDVDLHVYEARIIAGVPEPKAGQVLMTATRAELQTLSFCEADLPFVQALQRDASEGPGRLQG
ncbi:MAG: (deoxy)nucleoside triphosphate pyrophosphohydrolase [Myxococcaceae bacterium]